MKSARKSSSIVMVVFFLLGTMVPSTFAQTERVAVMTLKDGTMVSMTSAQLTALGAQPGITISTAAPATLDATRMAVPIPVSLGGGFIVGEPAAIAAGLNAAGATTTTIAASVAGATAATDTIGTGASAAGIATSAGVGVGTIALGAALAAALAATGGGGSTTAH